tara:strand:+ start:47794 stop:48801 length:1008 start_codon:yes stop_codon:yes gene_type:complete
MTKSILHNLTSPPRAGRSELYRWCDYIELRCLTHIDRRFSRDAFAEAIEETRDTSVDIDPLAIDTEEDGPIHPEGVDAEKDVEEETAANFFKHFRWREGAFGPAWPFSLDAHANEIQLKEELQPIHYLYLNLLLAASLRYSPKARWRDMTGRFERLSLSIFRKLMPAGAQVHAFGAAEGERYRGHLYNRLQELCRDIRGQLHLKRTHFAKNDAGDGGLDIVAWHDLGDQRDHIPISFAQCGCTADGWPNKMLEASPDKLAGNLHIQHPWATYYFMPLDLGTEIDGCMDWQFKHDMGRAIVIDRLRLTHLADEAELADQELIGVGPVNEARALAVT